MDRYFLGSHSPHYSHQSKDLDHLSPDRKQYLVNSMFNGTPPIFPYAAQHPQRLSIDIGPDYASRWLFSLEEILELGPPDLSVAHLINLDKHPVWLRWPHGKQLFVRTAEELARQPSGYGPTPDGPWPVGFEGPWKWEKPTKGPFAPSPYGSYAPGGPQAVYVKRPLVYHGRAIFIGALFLLEDSFTDEDLLSKEIVREVQPHDYDRLFEHKLTHWWFMNQRLRDDYAQRYEAGDLTGIEWTVHPQPDTASTAVPEDATQRATAPRGPQGRPRRYASAQDLHDELVTVGKTLPQDSRYRQEDYADALGMALDTLRSHLKHWRKDAPTGLLVWKRIVSDTKAQH